MSKEKKYEQMYGMFLQYEEELHKKNQKRIQIGLKVNIILPLIFLIIAFITEGSKLIFLILWIVSLFGIAFYLIYVEFTDYIIQKKIREIDLVNEREEETKSLIGDKVQAAESNISGKMDRIDEKIDEERKRIESELIQEKIKVASRIEEIKVKKNGKEDKDEEHN